MGTNIREKAKVSMMMRNIATPLITFLAGELEEKPSRRFLVSLKGSSLIAKYKINRGPPMTPSTKRRLGTIAMKIMTKMKLQNN